MGQLFFSDSPRYIEQTHKILDTVLRKLRSKVSERNGDDKPSVVKKIREARKALDTPKNKNSQKPKKEKGGLEL